MPNFNIIVYATGLDPEASDFEDRFYRAGCDDATISWSSKPEGRRIIIDFDREADSHATAVRTAVENVAAAGAHIVSIEIGPEDRSDRLLDLVRDYASRIKNGRTVTDVINHLETEVVEVRTEIAIAETGGEAGVDGVQGESIDIALCALDAIFVDDPGVSNEQILATALEKCQKWERHYAHSLTRER